MRTKMSLHMPELMVMRTKKSNHGHESIRQEQTF